MTNILGHDVNCIESGSVIIVNGPDNKKVYDRLKAIAGNDCGLTTPDHGQFQFDRDKMMDKANAGSDPSDKNFVWQIIVEGQLSAHTEKLKDSSQRRGAEAVTAVTHSQKI